MKRKMLLLIVLGLLVCFFPLLAGADIVDSGECGIGITWTLDDEGVLTISGSGYMTSKSWNQNFTKVVICNGVKNIVDEAFIADDSLKSITLPKTLETIGKNAFRDCDALTEITIPEGVISIEADAFSYSGIQKANIPSTVTKMGDYIFRDCRSLTDLTISEGIKYISDGAFEGCMNLMQTAIRDGHQRHNSRSGKDGIPGHFRS